MCKWNKICCFLLEIMVYLILLIVIIFGWIKLDITLSSKVGSLSILIAIIIFYSGWRINRYEHKKNQISLLKTLKFKIEEIETMVNSYKEQPLPFYLLPLPEESLYYKEIDYKIEGNNTDDLKLYINRIEDKAKIINLMMKKLHKSFDTYLKSNKVNLQDIKNNQKLNKKVKDFIDNNKIFNYYHPKILSILNEKDKKGLTYSLEQSKCILKERFNIK